MNAQTNQEVTWTSLELGELLEEEYAHVYFERTIKHMALHPYHLNNVQRGINQILKSSLNNYDKELKGFMLAFKNPGLLTINEIFYDSPFIHIDVEADFYLFRPTVGSFLKGIVNKKGLDHIVVLVHKTYTISIPKPDDTEEWLGDMVEIGQEVKCYIKQMDCKSKPPFICGVLKTNYSEGCRLFDSTLNTTDVIDTSKDISLNIESHDVKREKDSLLNFNVDKTERKRKKKHTKKTKTHHTMSDSEIEDYGVTKIKVEKSDPIKDGISIENPEHEVFDNQNEVVQNGNLELPENFNLKQELHKSLKRETSISLDNISETEKKKKKKHKKCDSNSVFTVDRKDGILKADLSANITNDVKNFNLNIESHKSLKRKRESSISLDNISETEKKKKKNIKKCDPDLFTTDKKDGILKVDLSASSADITESKKHKKSKKRLKSELEVEDYVPVKIKIEKSDPFLDE